MRLGAANKPAVVELYPRRLTAGLDLFFFRVCRPRAGFVQACEITIYVTL